MQTCVAVVRRVAECLSAVVPKKKSSSIFLTESTFLRGGLNGETVAAKSRLPLWVTVTTKASLFALYCLREQLQYMTDNSRQRSLKKEEDGLQ